LDAVTQVLTDAISTGLPYTLVFLGVWIVFGTQNDFDLTVEGSFTLGGAITAVWIVHGFNPWLSFGAAAIGGGTAGVISFTVMKLLKLRLILASIIVNIGLFSVNLHVLGLPSVALIGDRTIVSDWTTLLRLSEPSDWSTILLYALITSLVFTIVGLFLLSEVGLSLRAAGVNKVMTPALGISTDHMLLIAMVLGNALTAVGGGLVVQYQGFADVNMGVGTILFGITAIYLGATLVRSRGPTAGILTALVGTVLYRVILSLAYRVGVAPQDFNGLTALTVIGAVLLNNALSARSRRRQPPTRDTRVPESSFASGKKEAKQDA
jgi:putative tryptophan/tyrosine transport system permease protein